MLVNQPSDQSLPVHRQTIRHAQTVFADQAVVLSALLVGQKSGLMSWSDVQGQLSGNSAARVRFSVMLSLHLSFALRTSQTRLLGSTLFRLASSAASVPANKLY
jgi:hypothetical protein